MIVLLSIKDESQKEAVELTFKELGIIEYKLIVINASGMLKKIPLNCRIYNSIRDREKQLRTYCFQNNIRYDYLISFETGFIRNENGCYLCVCSMVKNKEGKEIISESFPIKISESIFFSIANGESLSLVFPESNDQVRNYDDLLKNMLGDNLNRCIIYKDIFTKALMPFIQEEKKMFQRKTITKKLCNHK